MRIRHLLRALLLTTAWLTGGGIVGSPDAAAAETTEPAEAVKSSATSQPGQARRENERRFPTLQIGELVYTNVIVHRQTNFNILIRHAHGIHTIRLTDLPESDLAALRPQLGELANIQEPKEPEIVSRLKEMQESEASVAYRMRMEEEWNKILPQVTALMIPVLGGLILIHLISSFFIYMLCKKTNTKAGFVVWLPLLNQTALLRAAGLPGVWALLGFMAPLIPIAVFSSQLMPPASVSGMAVVGISSMLSLASGIVWIVWCFKICVARQKNGWLGILLLIPGVNLLTLTYLAFAE